MTDAHIFDPHVFEVWFVRFRFEDDPTQYVERPALVIQERDGNAYALMMRITKNVTRRAQYDVILDDWAEAGLRMPSAVRCDKLMRVSTDDVVWRRPRFGALSRRDALKVLDMMNVMSQGGVGWNPV